MTGTSLLHRSTRRHPTCSSADDVDHAARLLGDVLRLPGRPVLYWLTNNLLSIAQQYLINKRLGVVGVAPRARARRTILQQLARRADPIVAVATSGRGAVGIVRVSGCGLAPLVEAISRPRALAPRHATHVAFLSADGDAIDRGLAIFFPAPHSYTGEDVLELQAHGGTVVLQLLVARCLEAAGERDDASGEECLPGLRIAAPGEFTERAFLNDKLDLAQAEAVADLIDASTEAAARSAAPADARPRARAMRPRRRSSSWACLSRRRSTSRRRRFPAAADAGGRLARARAGVDGAARARQGVAARRHPRRPRRPAERRQDRCSTRSPAPSWRSSRRRRSDATRSRRRSRSKAPVHVIDRGLGEASEEVERTAWRGAGPRSRAPMRSSSRTI
jgi:hypothetical protein